MLATKTEERVKSVISLLPRKIGDEILSVFRGRVGGIGEIREIRIRREGRCTVISGWESIPLLSAVTAEEISCLVSEICDGALYAHRDGIASGYITMRGGIRVGIGGWARYDGDAIVGVSDMRSLVFRIPGHECDFTEELADAFSGVRRGMLIYSPPGVGKTTALRSLSQSLGRGREAMRVCIVDERCEFDEEDYKSSEVDILKGYKKSLGLEIATRTLSPQVVFIDEISGEDSSSILGAVRCGIPLVATAHAGSFDELCKKSSLAKFFDSECFDVFVGIERKDGRYLLTVDKKG